MNKNLCIYHGNCADGFGAAWAVRKAFTTDKGVAIDFHPGVCQDPPPDCTDKHVIIVDFSYKRAVMEELLKVAASVTVLDHHKTAIEDLEPIKHLFADHVFDQTRSGAMIAWHYFFEEKAPKLIQHIQDRDLWKFELPGTREIQAALFSYPYDFEEWDMLMVRNTAEMMVEGEAIERKHFKDIRELLKVCRQPLYFKIKKDDMWVKQPLQVRAANLPYTLSSDAGHIMIEEEKEPFGCCFFFSDKDTVTFSLRSVDSGIDVSEIAKQFGGGGHRNAAGFKIATEHFLALLDQ